MARRGLVQRASRVVADELRAMILYGPLRDHAKLPSAPELAAQLGISRHHLREALRLLEQDGLVEVRPGQTGGIFRTVPSADLLSRTFEGLLASRGASLADLMLARQVLEPAGARLAALHATDPELAELERLIVVQEESERYMPELNSAFHVGVAEAGHNHTLALTMRSIELLMHDLDVSMGDPALVLEQTQAHRALLRALRERKADRAEAVMRRHIVSFEQRLRELGVDPATHSVAEMIRRTGPASQRGAPPLPDVDWPDTVGARSG